MRVLHFSLFYTNYGKILLWKKICLLALSIALKTKVKLIFSDRERIGARILQLKTLKETHTMEIKIKKNYNIKLLFF